MGSEGNVDEEVSLVQGYEYLNQYRGIPMHHYNWYLKINSDLYNHYRGEKQHVDWFTLD